MGELSTGFVRTRIGVARANSVLALVVLTALLTPILLAVPLIFADQAFFVPAITASFAAVLTIVAPVLTAVLPSFHAFGGR